MTGGGGGGGGGIKFRHFCVKSFMDGPIDGRMQVVLVSFRSVSHALSRHTDFTVTPPSTPAER